MPWVTPTLEALRTMNKANIQAQLHSGPIIPNSVLRVMADSNAGLAYLTLLYINWLSLQLLPDTAETNWLDRHAAIWLPAAGRKTATFAAGTILVTGTNGTPVPIASLLSVAIGSTSIQFQTTAGATLGAGPTSVSVAALTSGSTGLTIGSGLAFTTVIPGVNVSTSFGTIVDGIDQETDDELRIRVLERIRQPPMGGDASDFVAWAKATPGVNVTRAWCSPLEMGVGTVTIRFMTDDLINNVVGFPSPADQLTVTAYIDTVRPVTIKDRWILSPLPEPINFTVSNLSPDTVSNRNAIALSVQQMLFARAAPAHTINGVEQPAQTIYAAWVSEAISEITSIDSFTLTMVDHQMPYSASLGVLGTVVYA